MSYSVWLDNENRLDQIHWKDYISPPETATGGIMFLGRQPSVRLCVRSSSYPPNGWRYFDAIDRN